MDKTEPLDDCHNEVYSGTHVVCSESTHESVKFRRGRADAHEKRNLNEDDEERAHTGFGSAMALLVGQMRLTGRERRRESLY